MNKIVLRTPIKINNKEVKELTYDTAEITNAQFCEAEAYRFVNAGNRPTGTAYEVDGALHLYLGMMAVIAVNPEIDVTDLERIKGFDMIMLMRVGRNFIMSGAGGGSQPESSEDTSETIQEPSIAQ